MKKFLVLLLSLLMVISMVPTLVFAEEESEIISFEVEPIILLPEGESMSPRIIVNFDDGQSKLVEEKDYDKYGIVVNFDASGMVCDDSKEGTVEIGDKSYPIAVLIVPEGSKINYNLKDRIASEMKTFPDGFEYLSDDLRDEVFSFDFDADRNKIILSLKTLEETGMSKEEYLDYWKEAAHVIAKEGVTASPIYCGDSITNPTGTKDEISYFSSGGMVSDMVTETYMEWSFPDMINPDLYELGENASANIMSFTATVNAYEDGSARIDVSADKFTDEEVGINTFAWIIDGVYYYDVIYWEYDLHTVILLPEDSFPVATPLSSDRITVETEEFNSHFKKIDSQDGYIQFEYTGEEKNAIDIHNDIGIENYDFNVLAPDGYKLAGAYFDFGDAFEEIDDSQIGNDSLFTNHYFYNSEQDQFMQESQVYYFKWERDGDVKYEYAIFSLDLKCRWMDSVPGLTPMDPSHIYLYHYGVNTTEDLNDVKEGAVVYDYNEATGFMHIHLDESKMDDSSFNHELDFRFPEGAKYTEGVLFDTFFNNPNAYRAVDFTNEVLFRQTPDGVYPDEIDREFNYNLPIRAFSNLYVEGSNVCMKETWSNGFYIQFYWDEDGSYLGGEYIYWVTDDPKTIINTNSQESISEVVDVPTSTDEDTTIEVTNYPQVCNEDVFRKFFKLEGESKALQNVDGYSVCIPYGYFDESTNEGGIYKIKHYFNEAYSAYEILEGTPDKNGVWFTFDSFSPMVSYHEDEEGEAGIEESANGENRGVVVLIEVENSYEEDIYSVIIDAEEGCGNAIATISDMEISEAEEGDTITLIATPNEGYVFKEWVDVTGDAGEFDKTAATTTLTMPGNDIEVKATFELASCVHEDEDKDHFCDICDERISNHKGILKEGVSATTKRAGYKSYYECECGKYFEDKACSIEIKDLESWKSEGGNGYLPKVEDHGSPDTGIVDYINIWLVMIMITILTLCIILFIRRRENGVK